MYAIIHGPSPGSAAAVCCGWAVGASFRMDVPRLPSAISCLRAIAMHVYRSNIILMASGTSSGERGGID